MSFGFKIFNENGRFILDGNRKPFFFVGKATYISSSQMLDDGAVLCGQLANNSCSVEPRQSGDFLCPYPTQGQAYISVLKYLWYLNCGDTLLGFLYSLPIDVHYVEYTIESPSIPLVFLNNGVVVSVSELGSNLYKIAVICLAKTSDAVSEFSAKELYCFSSDLLPTEDFGMTLRNADGELIFNTSSAILDIKLLLECSVGSDLSLSYSGDPVSTLQAMSKPLFFGLDWCRFRRTVTYEGSLHKTKGSYYDPVCVSPCNISAGITLQGLGVGFEFSDNLLRYNLREVIIAHMSFNNPNTGYHDIYAPSTLTVPVIDGADYD